MAGVPGVGALIASAIVASAPDPNVFKSARDFAAWLGLDAQAELHRRQGEARLDHQTGQPLSQTASGVGRDFGAARGGQAQGRVGRLAGRARERANRRKVAAVALANKLARIIWAIMTTGEAFRTDIFDRVRPIGGQPQFQEEKQGSRVWRARRPVMNDTAGRRRRTPRRVTSLSSHP